MQNRRCFFLGVLVWFGLGCGEGGPVAPPAAKVGHEVPTHTLVALSDNRAVLAAVRDGATGLWGYIDQQGRWVIPPNPSGQWVRNPEGRWVWQWLYSRFSDARVFSEGLAAVRDLDTGRWGYIAPNGDWVIEPQFGAVYDFSEGLAAVWDRDSWTYGFIDKTGEWAIEPQFEWPSNVSEVSEYGFSEGLAAVWDGATGLWGYIDQTGAWAIQPQFAAAGLRLGFSEGLAAVRDGATGLWGYIEWSGAWGIEPQFNQAFSFSEGLASVRLDGRHGAFIDAAGHFAVEPGHYYFGSFSEGLAAVRDGATELWGYIDQTGAWAIQPQFAAAGLRLGFSEGLAAVLDGTTELWGYIDQTGAWAIQPQFNQARAFTTTVVVPPTEIIDLYGTLASSVQTIFLALLVAPADEVVSVPGQSGVVVIIDNDWLFRDFSPDGALVLNGNLTVNRAKVLENMPVPVTGTLSFSGSQGGELTLNMSVVVEDTEMSVSGTITINRLVFDIAELSAAAEAVAAVD